MVDYGALHLNWEGVLGYVAENLYWGRFGSVCRCRYLLRTFW